AGQSVSLVGDSVFLVAFTWQIAVEWHRPALLGLLLSARILVELVVLGGGGWIIDRVPRRTTVLLTDAVRGVVLLALAAALHQPPSTLRLALLVAAFGLLTALFRPALRAYVPEVVQRERLAAANSLLVLSQQTSVVLGPAIGAGLVGLGSAPTALRLDGLSFIVAALTTLPLPRRPPASPTGSALAQVAEGFRAARRVGWIGGSIVLFSMVNIATISAERLALPRAAEERFGALGGYGALLVAIGAGSGLAAVIVGRSAPPREPGRTAYSGLLLFGAATAGFGIARGLVAAVLIGLAFGFGQQLFELLWTIGLQQNVPDRLLGRINAVDQFGSFLFLPLSFAFGGLLVQSVDPALVMIAAGLVAVAAATIGVSAPRLHLWRPFPAGIAKASPASNGAGSTHPAHAESTQPSTQP
ncbi:MAG TPA: MFS transporter, partial [Actinomycetota bacterium]|nr:MFS transporter [Actinomycetota bacterium]